MFTISPKEIWEEERDDHDENNIGKYVGDGPLDFYDILLGACNFAGGGEAHLVEKAMTGNSSRQCHSVRGRAHFLSVFVFVSVFVPARHPCMCI